MDQGAIPSGTSASDQQARLPVQPAGTQRRRHARAGHRRDPPGYGVWHQRAVHWVPVRRIV